MPEAVAPQAAPFPQAGRAKDEILESMRAARTQDARWREGKVFSLVYYGGEEILELLKEAYTLFFSENGLNPTAFPSLRKFEAEVVGMTASLLGGDGQVAGNMTGGGTDSILLAVKTARDWARARHPEIVAPEMLLPSSAHPAFDKAAHYFGVKAVRVPVGADFRADVAAMRQHLTPRTILIVGSAPSYPQGMVDPISELAALAQAHGLLCHVDACVGGFVLPFARRLGYPVPPFDFSVPGVTSVSADLHKYGYAAKGASVILYRDRALRRHQFFVSTDWAGGIYASPGLSGTRPGGAIAAAWAVMNFLGVDGYTAIVDVVMRTACKLREGINAVPGLRVLGEPDMCVMAIGSAGLDVYEVADEMAARGWYLDRQQFPPSLHVTVTYGHAATADAFLADLAEAAAQVRRFSPRRRLTALAVHAAGGLARALPERWVSRLTAWAGAAQSGGGLPERSAPMYGLMGALPNRGDVDQIVLDILDGLTRAEVHEG
jgi:sphinganine-1-phosphate aldolase